MKDLYDDLHDAQTSAERLLELSATSPLSTGHRRNVHAEIARTAPELATFVTSPRTQAALRAGAWLLCQIGLDDTEPTAEEMDHALGSLGNSSVPDAIAAMGLADA